MSLGWYLEATAILVGFDGMLRIMELSRIQPVHLTGNLDSESMVLELPDTKTSSRKSTKEQATLTCPFATILLTVVMNDLQPGDLVFASLSSKMFRSKLRVLATALGLEELFKKLHSLRRGSATHRFRVNVSFDRVASEGRWENIRTARKDIDEAVSELSHFGFGMSVKLRVAEKLLLEAF